MQDGGAQWVRVRAKDVGFVQKSGSFRAALTAHLRQNVTSVFAAVLAALSTNDNLSLLVSQWDDASLRDRWLDLALSDMFDLHREVELNPDASMPYVVRTHWKHGHGSARSAFSWLLFGTVQRLRSKMEQLAGAKTTLECLREELMQHNVETAQSQSDSLWLSGEDAEPLLRGYATDFVRQAYAVGDECSRLFECLIYMVADLDSKRAAAAEPSLVDMFASQSPVPKHFMDVPAIHCAAWSLDSRLEQLSLLLSPATPLGASAEFLGVLHGTLVSLADDITLVQIDLVILRAVLDSLNLTDEQRSEQSATEWFRRFDALRAPAESWLSICQESVASRADSALTTELHDLVLRYDRLRCTHLFMRVTHAGGAALQLYSTLADANPHEPETLPKIKRHLETAIRDSEKGRFKGGMECAICFSIVQNGVALPCRHVYCAACIADTFPTGNFRCPECQTKVKSYVVDPAGDREVTLAAERVLALRDRCTQFFLEFVAEFLSEGFPGPVVEAIWPIITGQDLSFNRESAELELQSSPALCAYLLRVLLTLDETSSGEDCVQLLLVRLDAQAGAARDMELLTLVTEALEDVFCQRIAKHGGGSAEEIQQLEGLLEVAEGLSLSDGEATASSFLQAIAAMRIVLKAVAEELHAEAVGEAPNPAMAGVVQRAAAICEACQGKDRGPFMHLLKCLLQAHGRHALLEIAAQAEASHGPFAAMISEVVVVDPELPADQLVVQLQPGTAAEPYGEVLQLCRDVIDAQKAEELKAWVAQNQGPLPSALLSLAVCRVADEQHAVDNAGTDTTVALGEAIAPLLTADGVISKAFPVVNDLLNNGVGPDGSPLRFTADQALPDRQVMLLCLHSAVAVTTGNALTAPLAAMAEQAIAGMYLPTMRGGPMDSVIGLMGEGDQGHWYTCPNNHPYYIGNCGGAMEARACPECGATIGGGSHQLTAGNRAVDMNADTTPKGYVLTDELIGAPAGERALTIPGVALARVVLLSTMLSSVAVGRQESRDQAAASLAIAGAPADAAGLCGWLTERLRLSLDALAKAISRNVDDTIVVLHATLNRMMQHTVAHAAAGAWTAKPARQAWEQAFQETMATPVLGDLDKTLSDAAGQVDAAAAADEGRGSRRLLHELQETASAESVRQPLRLGDVELAPQDMPELWRYRTQVSIAHFQQRLAAAPAEVSDECPATIECTKHLTALGAMRFLPDILQLQRALVERLERRISRQDAAEVTLQAQLDELWPDARERAELDRCVASFLTAWDILRAGAVVNIGADTVLQLDDETLAVALTAEMPIQYFIPATSGDRQKSVPGQIGVAMANCLMNHHNELVRKLAAEGEEPAAISVRSTRPEHLITLDETALLPILFANVDRQVFTTSYGRGTKVEYAFAGVESAVRHQFIAGKPRVEVRSGSEMMTHVAFRNDVHAGHITAGLKESIPQEDLPGATVVSILEELSSSVDKTARTLRALETAIGFLHNSHGDGDRLKDMLLQDYLADVLMMEDDLGALLGKTAAKTVALRHILSLMQALDQQQAQEEVQAGRDTFELQPKEYKAQLASERAEQLRQGLQGANAHKLARECSTTPQPPTSVFCTDACALLSAAFLRAFILEHLTKENVGRYQPELLLVDASDDEMAEGLLEVLDYSNDAQELKEFWPLFGSLRLRTDEAISFWKLVVGQSASAGSGAAARAGPAEVALGTMASRQPAFDMFLDEPEPEPE